jgi:hypothetical protein
MKEKVNDYLVCGRVSGTLRPPLKFLLLAFGDSNDDDGGDDDDDVSVVEVVT